jgi:hypothetical protein
MSCSGSHLGITINIKNTKFVKDLPMIDAQFRFNQCNSFREEYISVFSPYIITILSVKFAFYYIILEESVYFYNPDHVKK